MSEGDNFGLVESFDVDGKLGGLTSEESFTMGVEWADWYECIRNGVPKTKLVLARNSRRIESLLERHGWMCEDRPFQFLDAQGAPCNQWREMWVGDRTGEAKISEGAE